LAAARKTWIVLPYLLVILWVNAYICRDLFFTEYTGHMNSLQGLWISIARLAGEHCYRPAWWPYHDAGEPFEHTYMPLVPAATALYARLGHVSASRAFNGITGILYCLGPLTLFLLAWQMTRAPGYSFWAALAYSLTSPARALMRDPNFNPAFFWTSRRLYTMVVWDDVPHGAAVCLLPLVVLCLWLALEKRRPIYYALTAVAMAMTVAASVFGALAILMSVLCLLFVLPRKLLWSHLPRVAILGGVAYLLICPFLPPSLLQTIRANQQHFPEDQWSAGSLTALSAVILGWAVVWWLLRRWTADGPLRFFMLFAYVTSAIPLLDAYCNRHFLPQSGRYQPEMEIALALAAVFALRPALDKLPRSVKVALGLFALSIASEQLASHRRYAKDIIWPVDIRQSIEYRVARWVDTHIPGQRVMVPGSIAQWFNVFSDSPQLSGGSYSTTPNWTQQDAMVTILSSKGPQAGAQSLLWLKAFGIQAVAVTGPGSKEFWRPIADPTKFDGLLPVLWSEDGVTIYRVPQRSTSLAHVIPPAAIARHDARDVLSYDELEKYVAALDDPTLAPAEIQWESFHQFHVRTTARLDQVVSVQTSYHPGWHASVNGREAAITRDGLRFLVIHPKCDGPCEIEMTYDGGWEYKLCRLLSALTILGLILYTARNRRVTQPLSA
jgi:hypothetical protein